jgi:hypothetical protein
MSAPTPAKAGGRDLRVDFFRGLALLAIFINHIPDNLFSVLTTRNWGFSDASEIFVFLSGYSAALVFQMRQTRSGYVYAAVENLKRCWTLYVVHVFVFVLFVAQVSITTAQFGNPMFIEEMKMGDFLAEPHVAVVEALLLRFQPRFLDILPLYILFLLALPAVMALAPARMWLALGASALFYLAVRWFEWRPTAYPDDREWTFNPLAWQLLFMLGAWCGRRQALGGGWLPRGPWLLWPVAAYLAFAAVVQVSWTVAGYFPDFPALLERQLWPLDKANLSGWRLAHFLCLAFIVARLTRADMRFFAGPIARPFVICGKHALDLFCLGIFLSFFGHLVQVELSDQVWVQALVFLGGCAIMIAVARVNEWYKERFGGSGPKPPRAPTVQSERVPA